MDTLRRFEPPGFGFRICSLNSSHCPGVLEAAPSETLIACVCAGPTSRGRCSVAGDLAEYSGENCGEDHGGKSRGRKLAARICDAQTGSARVGFVLLPTFSAISVRRHVRSFRVSQPAAWWRVASMMLPRLPVRWIVTARFPNTTPLEVRIMTGRGPRNREGATIIARTAGVGETVTALAPTTSV